LVGQGVAKALLIDRFDKTIDQVLCGRAGEHGHEAQNNATYKVSVSARRRESFPLDGPCRTTVLLALPETAAHFLKNE
jgi:hypothetical protein